MEEVDFLVVGTGSGLEVANVAAERGRSVAVVEKDPVGGTCLNRGCIPSKTLLYHADVLETIERADAFHIDVDVNDVAFADIVREVNAEVADDSDAIREGLRASSSHHLFEGEGRFVGERTIEMATGRDEGTHVRAETVLIAAGSRPAIPSIEGIDEVPYVTSTEAMHLETPPDHLLIVGGGYVAAELAHFFGTFGSDVTIVGRRPELLPGADEEVAAAFTELYADRFTVHTGYSATAVSERDGAVTVEARPYEYGGGGGTAGEGGTDGRSGEVVDDRTTSVGGDEPGRVTDGEPVTATGDALLVAADRIPNSDTLNLDAAGVAVDDRGFVETDEYLRTTADGVWALGDVVGEYLLKHNANHEARAVARNLFGAGLEPVDYTAMPFAVFGSPEVAGVGAREEDLRAAGRRYATRTYPYDGTARGDAMAADGFAKVLIDLEGEILGCHIVGPHASCLIQEVVVAMKAGSGTVRDVRESVHVHPALPEVVQRAFLGEFTRGDHHHHDEHTDADHARDDRHHHPHGHPHDDHGHPDGDHGHPPGGESDRGDRDRGDRDRGDGAR